MKNYNSKTHPSSRPTVRAKRGSDRGGTQVLSAALLCCFLTIASLHAAKQPITGKTFFKQGNNLLWRDASTGSDHMGPRQARATGLGNITTTAIAQTYYFESNSKKRLGNYFGYYDDGTEKAYNSIGVGADDSLLMYPQDIIHDVDNADSFDDATKNPLKQIISFNPSITQTGLVLGTRTQFGRWASLEVLLPWEWRTHKMGLVTSKTVKQTVEGKAVTLLDYMQGTVQQVADDNAKNKQQPLVYSKLKDKQTVEGLADLLLTLSVSPVIDESGKSNFSLGLTLRLPTTDGAHGQYQFEPLIGSGGHTMVGFSGSWHHTIASVEKYLDLSFGGSLNHTIGISRHETRMPNIALFDGSAARFSRLNLAGKENTQRLVPFPNILTQQVSVTPGSSTDIRLHASLHYRWLRAQLGYHFAHSNGERVTLVGEWPSTVYGRTKFAYEADGGTGYTTFQPASHSATRDSSFNSIPLPEERLLASAAATPAQTSHGLCFGIECAPPRLPSTRLFFNGAYHFVFGSSFGLEGILLTAGMNHQF